MIDFHIAVEIARKYYAEKGQQELTKVYDAEKIWIVYAGKKDQPKFGNAGIAIDKKQAKSVDSFFLLVQTLKS